MEPMRDQARPYVFLSYSSSDRDRALQIADLLDARGVSVWIDRRHIIGGTTWSQEIVQGIEGSAVVFLLCSATSMVSRNVQQEIQLAWEMNRPILPMMLEPVQIAESIRYAVVGRQWLELFGRSDDDWIPEAMHALMRLGVTPEVLPARVGSPNDASGDRRCPSCQSLVAAGALVCATCGAALVGDIATGIAGAERRSLSVMALEFLPVSEADEPLDPEDFAVAVHEAHQRALAVLARHDGTPMPGPPHELTAYFGVPSIHEDDVRRTARAALEIVEAIDQLPQHRVRACAALHSGVMVVGGDMSRAPRITGDVPAVASAMLAVCEPGTVVASAAIHRLLDGYFRTSELGLRRFRGHTQPMELFQVLEESDVHSRIEIAASRGLAPLVGRQSEMSLLRERWERSRDGEGQVVLLVGEPGIGKSRLSFGLREEVGADPNAWIIALQCAEIHQQTPFHPVIELFERQVLNFSTHMTLDDRRAAIQTYLANAGGTFEHQADLLSSLLGIPVDAGSAGPPIAPERQRRATIELLVSLVLDRAARQPVLVQFEDLHWADPSTVELLTMLVDYSPSTSLMLVVTSRPTDLTNWINRPHVTTMNLSRLPPRLSVDLINQVADGVLPPPIVDQIVSKADGVPLFLEELTRALFESGEVRQVDGQFEVVADAGSVGIPATLYDLLLARLDRLGEAREVAQLGATIGREFSFELLNAVSPWGEQSLRHVLARLAEADLIQQRGLPSQATYVFRHSLVQDAAYGSLVRDRRQQFHRQIASALVDQFPETVDNRPELIAYHFMEAGAAAQAIPWWLQAGQRAVRNSANVEAVTHLTRGLELLKELPESVDLMQAELGLQMNLGLALMTTRGFAAPELEIAFQRAHDLCRAFGDVPEVIPVLHGLWTFYVVRAELETAHQIADRLLRLGETSDDDSLLVQALLHLGVTDYFMGELETARSLFERAIAMYDPTRHAANAYIYGHEPGASTLSYLSLSLCLMGFVDQGLARSRSGVDLGRSINHPLTFSRSLSEAALVRCILRDPDEAYRWALDAQAFSSEHGVVAWLAAATAILGWATAMRGDTAQGIDLLQQGLDRYQATGAVLGIAQLLQCLAEAHDLAGNTEEARLVIERAIDSEKTTGALWVYAESLRLKAKLLLEVQETDAGQQCLRDALEIARTQHAHLFELRIATDLARLLHSQGRSLEGREILAPVFESFSEGHDVQDYFNARALLDQLSN